MSSEESQADGRNVWIAATLLSEVGCQIEAMLDEVAGRIEKAVAGRTPARAERQKDKWKGDESGWITLNSFRQWAIKPKGKGNHSASGWLMIQVVVGSTGETSVKGIPHVLVAYGDGDEWEAGDHLSDASMYKLHSCGKLKVGQRGFARWDDEDVLWGFVVPLFAIASTKHVEELLVIPTIDLLNGNDPERVFANNAAALTLGE